MKVLGISAYFHDSAAALVSDGEIVAAAQEERFSRLKHDAALPVQAAAFCLEEGRVSMDEIDHVVFYEKPLRKFERILVTHLREFPKGILQFSRSLKRWLSARLWIKGEILRTLNCRADQLLFSEHHLSHAASAFLPSPFESAAIVTADGVGEWTTTGIYRGVTDGNGSRIEKLRELQFPHSIGLLYSAITAYLGFEVNEGEYKVMGLAPYGAPTYFDQIQKLCTVGDDASLTLDMRYFCYHRHPTKSFTKALEELLGPARVPGSTLILPADSGESRRFADIAASLQKFTEDYMLKLAEQAHKITGESNLVMAGGVALNCVANHRILREGPFKGMYVQPAAGDAGGALGAALYVSHVIRGVPRRPSGAGTMFLGSASHKDSIAKFLGDCGVRYQMFPTHSELCVEVARLLAEGAVGGWFQGRFEFGPRALGARSIIADPRGPLMRDRVNMKIKFREGFRPFAPAVLAEDMKRWFIIPDERAEHMTPFMCTIADTTDEARATIPAVVHVDGTSRVQRVDAADNPVFHELLTRFKERCGIGVVLNTSMNLKDEPICGTPAEAFATFTRSDLDFLALENCLVKKEDCVFDGSGSVAVEEAA